MKKVGRFKVAGGVGLAIWGTVGIGGCDGFATPTGPDIAATAFARVTLARSARAS